MRLTLVTGQENKLQDAKAVEPDKNKSSTTTQKGSAKLMWRAGKKGEVSPKGCSALAPGQKKPRASRGLGTLLLSLFGLFLALPVWAAGTVQNAEIAPAAASVLPGASQNFSFTAQNTTGSQLASYTVSLSYTAGLSVTNLTVAPSAKSATIDAAKRLITVQWTNVANGTTLTANWKASSNTSGTYTISKSSITYKIGTTSYTGGVNSATLTVAVAADTTPPTPPTGLAATPGVGQVTLNWSANSEPDLAGYNVYRATVAGGPYTKVNASLIAKPTTAYTNTGLTGGTTYYYTVTAADTAGNESAKSAQVSATPTTADTTAPTITAVRASASAGTSAAITWTTNEPATRQVEYGPTAAYGQSSPLDNTLVTGHSVTLTGLTSNSLYHYRVKSRDAAGNLALSGDFTFNTGVAPGSIEYVYDELGRLTGVINASGQSARYVYDALGNVTAIGGTGAGAVTIIEFTPNSGAAGTTVTINGAGFSATANQNTVRFNGVAAAAASATATQLVVTVPAGATTGRITVTTPAGTATSATDFVVTAAGAGVPTITGFSPTTGVAGIPVTITGTNFDPALGATKVKFNQTSSTTISGVTPTSVTAVVPTNAASGKIQVSTVNGTATSAGDFIIPPTGINPADIIATQRIQVAGSAQTLDVNTASKVGLLLFDGVQGSYLTLNLTSFSVSPSTSSVPYEIYTPRGVLLASGSVSATVRSIHIPALPNTGTYSVYFKPGTATVNLAASLVVNQAIALDGAALNQTLSFTGQTARLTFAATVGQNLGLGISSLTLSPTTSTSATVIVYKPDGTLLTSTTCYVSSGSCELNLANLPATGTYSVVVTQVSGGTGSFTATLSSDIVVPLALNGASSNVSITRIGQSARLTFNGTAGEYLGLGISNLTLTPSGATSATVAVYKPDGTYWTSAACTLANQGCGFNLSNLPTTGSYSAVISPPIGATGSFVATLSSDVIVPLVLNTSSNVSIPRAGQNARLTFSVTAGENRRLTFSSAATTPSGQKINVTIYYPDGSYYYSFYLTGGGIWFNLTSSPVNGTWTALVEPDGPATASITVTLSP